MSEECSFDPEPLENIPLGMFHCPECGEMVVGGFPHPRPLTDEDFKRLEELDDQNKVKGKILFDEGSFEVGN
jgi:transcription initiation factor IIE alpha subunit